MPIGVVPSCNVRLSSAAGHGCRRCTGDGLGRRNVTPRRLAPVGRADLRPHRAGRPILPLRGRDEATAVACYCASGESFARLRAGAPPRRATRRPMRSAARGAQRRDPCFLEPRLQEMPGVVRRRVALEPGVPGLPRSGDMQHDRGTSRGAATLLIDAVSVCCDVHALVSRARLRRARQARYAPCAASLVQR